MSNGVGILFIVATPIGNLEDLSSRALRVLSEVDLILAEDTRHSGRLLQNFGISTPTRALHEHNERERAEGLVQRLQAGESLALISDAGTPLVSDPGFPLVQACQQAGIPVSPVPGPCAAVAALSCSGLPSDRFLFLGFPPSRSSARQKWLQSCSAESATLILYESPHRIVECLADIVSVFGPDREAVLARELTKLHETIRRGPLAELAAWVAGDPNQRKGEIVVLLSGAEPRQADEVQADTVLSVLLEELPAAQAAKLTSRLTGLDRKNLYQRAQLLKKNRDAT